MVGTLSSWSSNSRKSTRFVPSPVVRRSCMDSDLAHLGINCSPLLKSQVKPVNIGSDHRLVFLSYRPVLGLTYHPRSFTAFHPADNTPTLTFDAPQGWENMSERPGEKLNGRSSGLSCALLLQPSNPQTAFIFPRCIVLFFHSCT